jgi:hypothetical protein
MFAIAAAGGAARPSRGRVAEPFRRQAPRLLAGSPRREYALRQPSRPTPTRSPAA